MRCFEPYPLYFITHPEKGDVCSQVLRACRSGVRIIQLRMKNAAKSEIKKIIDKVLDEAMNPDLQLIVNDHVDIAAEYPVTGVHLGQEDMTVCRARKQLGDDKVIGSTANTLEQMVKLAKDGVDYIGLGPFRYTTTKSKLAPVLGIEGITSCVSGFRTSAFDIPVYAIGGIRPEDIPGLMAAGVTGVAVSSALVIGDITINTENFEHQLQQKYVNDCG